MLTLAWTSRVGQCTVSACSRSHWSSRGLDSAGFQRWGDKLPFATPCYLLSDRLRNGSTCILGSQSLSQIIWSDLDPHLEPTSNENSPIGSGPLPAEPRDLTPVSGPEGKASCYPSLPSLLPTGLLPTFFLPMVWLLKSASISVDANRHGQWCGEAC